MTVTPFQPFSASGSMSHKSSETSGVAATCGKVFQSQAAAITIFTAEGDKVTLSASSERRFEFATYNAQGFLGGLRSSENSQSLSISVEGELSRQELKDIRKAVRTIGRAADELIEGDVKGAERQVEKLQRLDTLSQVQAEVEVKREVSVGTLAFVDCPAGPAPEHPASSAPKQPETPCAAPPPAPPPTSETGSSNPTESLLHKLIEEAGKAAQPDHEQA